ncbi:hypothetical protein M422DRAFT_43192 [Sphaerobolus stellatus SS14]|nr:hypothetical protein M422DRAFT_43192 [Sphaerobolus stellatus SS14]
MKSLSQVRKQLNKVKKRKGPLLTNPRAVKSVRSIHGREVFWEEIPAELCADSSSTSAPAIAQRRFQSGVCGPMEEMLGNFGMDDGFMPFEDESDVREEDNGNEDEPQPVRELCYILRWR